MSAALQFARDVMDMHERIQELESEVARLQDYQRKYHELLDDSTQHNQNMLGGIFKVGMEMARLRDAQATGSAA